MAKSLLLRKDDYWSIWIGLGLLLVSLFIFFIRTPSSWKEKQAAFNLILAEESSKAPYKTIAWQEAFQEKEKLQASKCRYTF